MSTLRMLHEVLAMAQSMFEHTFAVNLKKNVPSETRINTEKMKINENKFGIAKSYVVSLPSRNNKVSA
jgi:hypothetical protein